MTEKRLIIRDGDYAWIDTVTDTVIEVEDAFDLVNTLHEKNQHLLNIINCLEEGSCRSIDSFLDSYCSEELLKEYNLE